MAKKKGTENRTNKNRFTKSQQREAANAAIDGRGGRIASFRSGASTAEPVRDSKGYSTSERDFMRAAWNANRDVQTYTRTKRGAMSENGKKAGGTTWTYTNRDMDGNFVRQSGRSKVATRRQREYDTRKGMNNISPKVVQAWLDKGLARVVDGNMVGGSGQVIRQNADGTYSMGLSVG